MDTEFKKSFLDPSIEYRPEFRWWLAEGSHTDETLKNDIQMAYDSGFGAMEFVSLNDEGVDSKRYGWGSEEWFHDAEVIVKETTKKRMGFSMTSGANWSNSNLASIRPDDKAASKELDYACEWVKAGQKRSGLLPKPRIVMQNVAVQSLVAVIAAKIERKDEDKTILDRSSFHLLTEQVKMETLSWSAPEDGDYILFAFYMHGTGQTAEPSSSLSFTINYIDRYGMEAWIEYWNRKIFNDEMKRLIAKNSRGQIYIDSLELFTYGKGGQLWGYHLLDEFRNRRGYDLTPFLPLIIRTGDLMSCVNPLYPYVIDDTVFCEKLHNDLYQTMTEMYMENTLKPLQAWLHTIGMEVRSEISYGTSFEISEPGKYVDGLETESLEFASQIDMHRGLSGAAHIYNHIFSCETGCAKQNYKKGLDFYTQMIFTQFAAGVSKTVLHGYSSICGSEKATKWPGHEGMMKVFSDRFGCRQPAYSFYPEWSQMLTRYQYVLRQGKPRVDLAIMRLDYAYNNMLYLLPEPQSYESMWMRVNAGIYWQDTSLQNAGYTYDYLAPQILEDTDYQEGCIAPEGPGYRALLIYQEGLPYKTACRIYEWAKNGLKVVFVDHSTEMVRLGINKTHEKAASRTPYNDGKEENLKQIITEMKKLGNVGAASSPEEALSVLRKLGAWPRAAYTEPNKNVLSNMRQDGNTSYLFLYNCMYTEKDPTFVKLSLEKEGTPYYLNCSTGRTEEIPCFRHDNGHTSINVKLEPGEAVLLALDTSASESVHVVSTDADRLVRTEEGTFVLVCDERNWKAELSNGGIRKGEEKATEDIRITNWTLDVEDWNEGDKKFIREDRDKGYTTEEVYYETKKDIIHIRDTKLKPWKDITEIGPNVSGIGHYSTVFHLPDAWSVQNAAFLKIGKTGGNPVMAWINGRKTKEINIDNREIEITDLVKAGDNIICIDVPTTLNNRLMSRNYYDDVMEDFIKTRRVLDGPHLDPPEDPPVEGYKATMGEMFSSKTEDYGILDEVKILTFIRKKII